MKQVTVHFEDIDFAEFALRNIRAKTDISNISVKANGSTEEDTAMYPVKPEYLEPSHMQYLEGMPHVLSNGPVFNRYYEPSHKKDAVVSFFVESKSTAIAVNVAMQFGGHNITVQK